MSYLIIRQEDEDSGHVIIQMPATLLYNNKIEYTYNRNNRVIFIKFQALTGSIKKQILYFLLEEVEVQWYPHPCGKQR